MSLLERVRTSRVLGPFTSLVSAQVIGTGLGFVYWVVAARLLRTDVVGVAAAAISAQTLLGTLSTMGLGMVLLQELQTVTAHHRRRLLSTGLMVGGLSGAAVGLGSVLVVLFLSNTLHAALTQPTTAGVYVVGVAATSVALVLDQAVLGLGRSRLQVWRNLLASGLRFPVLLGLLALGADTPVVLVTSWVAPWVLSITWVWRAAALPRSPAADVPARGELVRRYWRLALHNQALSISLAAGPQLVPVVAGAVLGAVANAEFTIAWLMATFVFIPPYMLATALFAASVAEGVEEFRLRARRTLPWAMTLSASLCLLTWLFGQLALRIFGAHYADYSAHLLDLLVLGGLWMVFKDHLVAYARVAGRYALATKLTGVSVPVELGGAVTGALLGGAEGLCIGWLATLGLEAVLGAPLVWRVLSGARPRQRDDQSVSREDRTGTPSH